MARKKKKPTTSRKSPTSRMTQAPATLDGAVTRISANPDGTLKLISGRRTFKSVRVKIGRPLFRPMDFAALLNHKHDVELGHLINLPGLSQTSRAVLEDHCMRANLTTKVLKVHSLLHHLSASYWDVDTEKGRREFVIRGTTEHIRFLSDDRLLITDVRGNRFEIPSLSALDKKSQRKIHLIL